jgi:hypothetical protein
MKRRQFVVSSLIGSVGLLTRRLPLFGDVESAATAATRKILIAGGNYNTAFIRTWRS